MKTQDRIAWLERQIDARRRFAATSAWQMEHEPTSQAARFFAEIDRELVDELEQELADARGTLAVPTREAA